jgi:very-short-patch-repair endonuclease
MSFKIQIPFDKEEAVRLFEEGKNPGEISEIIGGCRHTIWRYLRRIGVWVDFDKKGRVQSEEWVRKRCVRKEGYVSPLKGKKLDRLIVEKAIAAREKNVEFRKRRHQRMIGNTLTLGMKHTADARRKMREAQSREELKALHRRVICSRIQKKSMTDIEMKVARQLDSAGLRYVHQFFLNEKYLYDFLLVDRKILIECDGDYWHSLNGMYERDLKKDVFARENGFEIMRFRGSEILKNDFDVGVRVWAV